MLTEDPDTHTAFTFRNGIRILLSAEKTEEELVGQFEGSEVGVVKLKTKHGAYSPKFQKNQLNLQFLLASTQWL